MIDIVIPTIGRPSLRDLLASIAAAAGPLPDRVIVVDDRRTRESGLDLGAIPDELRRRVEIVTGRAAGPAAARNSGWHRSRATWVAFLDDDVIVDATWLRDLQYDIAACSAQTAGSQGRIHVPLPHDRNATDWERNVAGLVDARWITADCAYRRDALLTVGGFDERFPRAFREDADLGLRIVARGWDIARGSRQAIHPVRNVGPYVSVALQAGNADDVLMEALHGSDWYERAGAARGEFSRHVIAVVFALTGCLGALGWLAHTLDFARRRIAPGPRTPREIITMLVTSALIPFAAVGYRIAAYARLGSMLANRRAAPVALPRAVLFDRDGTLVTDVAYNGDPQAVVPVDGALDALTRLRAAGIATGIVSNQSGVALGKFRLADMHAVNERIDELLGPFATIAVCTHAAETGCSCRKPAPGLILSAAQALGIRPKDCVVIGDIGSDVDAARAAGARAILVPTPVTQSAEILAAPEVASDLADAVDRIFKRPG